MPKALDSNSEGFFVEQLFPFVCSGENAKAHIAKHRDFVTSVSIKSEMFL